MESNMQELLDQLRLPFHPSMVEWKPGATKGDKALALAYADLRAYMNRLDEVCGMDWSIEYKPWGDNRIIACLTINGVTRCSTGEMAAQDEKNEMGGTVAEAQALKRACAMFGLGRYLYTMPSGWADYDPATKRFTDKAKAKLTGILVQHYRRATEGRSTPDEVLAAGIVDEQRDDDEDAKGTPPHQRMWGIGKSVFGNDWNDARGWLIAKWTSKVTPDNTRNSATELSDTEKDQFGDYMNEHVTKLQQVWKNFKAAQVQATN